MLEELSVPYENVNVLPVSRAVRKYNKTGKVPVLLELDSKESEDPSFVLFESVAINTYLGDNYGANTGLVPPALTRERAIYDQTVCYILSELDAQGLWIHRKHEGLGKHFGYIPEAVEAGKQQFVRINEDLAGRLNPYLLGERFTAADIMYVHCLDWAKGVGWHESWSDNVEPYRKMCHQRPAYQRAKALRDAHKQAEKEGGTDGQSLEKISNL
jgi:glutathione S-transferase